MTSIRILIATIFAIVVTSCTSTSTIDNFTYSYSMESVNNFKIEFQLKSDSTYKISQYNYFFDNFEKMKKPIETEGKLNDKEFSTFKKLLGQSNIPDMKDSYGFEDSTKNVSEIVYLIGLNQNEESKFISINANSIQSFPPKFSELISYTNTIISEKHKVL